MSEKQMSLGAILKQARVMRGMSRSALADEVGFSANAIAKYEKAGEAGGQFPSMPRLAKLSGFFRIDARLILASTAEDPADAQVILSTDAVGSGLKAVSAMMEKFALSLAQVRAEAERTKDFETLAGLSTVSEFFGEKAENVALVLQGEDENPEKGLAASPGSPSTINIPTKDNIDEQEQS